MGIWFPEESIQILPVKLGRNEQLNPKQPGAVVTCRGLRVQ